jgi:hypothetical protein
VVGADFETWYAKGRFGPVGVVMKRFLLSGVVAWLGFTAVAAEAKMELRNISGDEQLELDAGRSIERRFELRH